MRDSIVEALTLWRKLSGNGEEGEEIKGLLSSLPGKWVF